MNRILLVPSSDYIGHPFPQRHNQIFDRLHDGKDFEVHLVRFKLFERPKMRTNLVVHELDDKRVKNVALYYLVNAVQHSLLIRKIVRQESIDAIVLSNLAAPFVYTLLESLSSLDVPIVFDLPDYYPTSAAGYMFNVKNASGKLIANTFDWTLRFVMRHAAIVTAASQALVDYASRSGAKAVEHIPNGVSECFLKLSDGSILRDKLGYCKEDLVAGYIGSMEFWLEMRSLVKGVALARKEGLPTNLLLLGGRLHTDYSEKVKRLILHENLEEYTTWLDFVPHEQVPMYIAGLDVGTIPFDVLNPTAYYAAPNKLWEYMSQMKPVISTPIPEIVSNSDCVLMALTPEDYARQFWMVAKGGNKLSRKIEVGYRRALNQTWRKSADIFASTICTLLNRCKN